MLDIRKTANILYENVAKFKYLGMTVKGKVIPLQARCGPEGG